MRGSDQSNVAEQLAMFESVSEWQWQQATRLTRRVRRMRRVGLSPARSVRALQEISQRSGQMLREYWGWLEREGVAEAVQDIIAKRHTELSGDSSTPK